MNANTPKDKDKGKSKDALLSQYERGLNLRVYNAPSQSSPFNTADTKFSSAHNVRHKRRLGVERTLDIKATHENPLVYRKVLNLRTFPSVHAGPVLINSESAKNTGTKVSAAENRERVIAPIEPRSLTLLFNHNMKQLVAARASSAISSIENGENIKLEDTNTHSAKPADRYKH